MNIGNKESALEEQRWIWWGNIILRIGKHRGEVGMAGVATWIRLGGC